MFYVGKSVFYGVMINLLFLVSLSHGEYSKTIGPYTFHYVAFNSSFLSPEVASAYGITRGKDIGLVNISVQETGDIGIGKDVAISGYATNMIQQVRYMEFTEIREEKAVYYIAPFKFDDEDILTFKFDIKIKETGRTEALKWQQKLWEQ